MGTLQRRQGKLEEAERSYTTALAFLPGNVDVLRNRASLYGEMEQWEAARVDYTEIVRQRPHDEEAHYERAMVSLMLGDTLGARTELESIDTWNPKSARARLGMAHVYKTMEEYGLAAELYDVLIEANPQNASLYMQRAEVYYLSGRAGAALTDINRSIELNRRDPLAFALRAKIRLLRGDKVYAKRDVEQAIELGLEADIADDLIKKCK
jgi:tetratricopeptide (TPR) repeat protein